MPGITKIEAYSLPARGSLPTNLAQWNLCPQRAVLLIHDMQKYFLKPLENPLRAELVRNVVMLRERCMGRGMPVAYTLQPGRMTDEQRGLLKDFWGPGMRSEPIERDVVPELAPAAGHWIFTKWRYSAFFRSDLLKRMRSANRDQIVLCGVYAHVGVLSTALDAFTYDIQPFLVADAIADFSETDHRSALSHVARCCGMVLHVAEVFHDHSS
jgi:isochorismate hydrolase